MLLYSKQFVLSLNDKQLFRVYRDISLAAFVVQRAYGNSFNLYCLLTLSSAELNEVLT